VLKTSEASLTSQTNRALRIRGAKPYYKTSFGAAYCGDALKLTKKIPSDCVNLVLTSPPFALVRKKTYGNVDADKYVEWFMQFADDFHRILRSDGSLVIHMGGSWVKGKPIKSLHLFELLVRLCKEAKFHLAQDLYWFNSAKLPSPAQWVTVKRWRLKDAVDHVWWLCKTPYPKADNRNVLAKYSRSMENLLEDKDYYKPNVTRPSEHRISAKFRNRHKGPIPPNLFTFANTDSQSRYLTMCRINNIRPHPARYPEELPAFLIKLLTDEGDMVFDPFGGSNATGSAAEALRRRWITFEIVREYLEASMFRFDL